MLVSLTVPSRRSLIDRLVVAPGTTKADQVLDLTEPDERIADFLAAAAHTDGGFVARTDDGERALAMVAATAAALCGEDIRRALHEPDTGFLSGLQPQAVEAVRAVLLAVESSRAEEVEQVLRVALDSGGERN